MLYSAGRRADSIGNERAVTGMLRRLTIDHVALSFLAICLLLVLLTFRNYGVTWDEPGLRTYGRLLVDWYRSGFSDDRAWEFANLRYYGGGFDILSTILEPLTPLEPYELRHLLGGLLGLLGIAFVWRLGRRLGGPRTGLIAAVLLASLPGWWGHMFFNSKDVPFAVGVLATILVWGRCLDEWPKPRLTTALLLGLALGLTLGVRIGGVLVAIYLAPSLLVLTAMHARRHGPLEAASVLGTSLVRLATALPVLLVVMIASWPWVVLAPGNLVEALTYLSRFPYTADTIFAGHRYPAPAVPAAYWPTLLLLQMPEVILVGLAPIALFRPLRGSSSRQTLALLTVMIAGFFPLLYATIARPTAYNNLRHFIFVLPPLVVLAALGVNWMLERLRGTARALAMAAVVLGILVPTLRMIQLHPYEYIYFNDLSGGVRGADRRFELDYWGTSFGELGKLVERRVASPVFGLGLMPVPVRVCGPFETAQEVLPTSLLPVYHNAPARLAIALAIFFCRDPPRASEIVRVERLGVVLSRAYRVDPQQPITDFTQP